MPPRVLVTRHVLSAPFDEELANSVAEISSKIHKYVDVVLLSTLTSLLKILYLD